MLQACATTYHVEPAAERGTRASDGSVGLLAGPWFVANKELTAEYQIFRQSGRFREASEPAGAISVHLHPLHRIPACGNPLLGSLFTAGLIPVTLPHGAIFAFSTTENGRQKTYDFRLEASARTSLWDWAVKPFNSEAAAYAEALRIAPASAAP